MRDSPIFGAPFAEHRRQIRCFHSRNLSGRLWGHCAQPSSNAKMQWSRPAPGDGMKRRVLIVDDEPQIRDMLREWLTRTGYDVSDAPDGKQAIEILRKQSFDVVVADILM